MRARRGNAGEVAISNDDNAAHGFCGGVIGGSERRAKRRRPQNSSVKHSFEPDVARVLVTSSDKRAAIHLRKRLPRNLPFRRGCDGILRGEILRERLAAGEFRISQRTFRNRIRHLRVRSDRSEEHTSELQSRLHLVCRLLLAKKQLATATRKAPGSNQRNRRSSGRSVRNPW